jgi:hypothetical protein
VRGSEREQHAVLVRYAVGKLEKIGIKNVSCEAKIPGDGRVDILAFDRDKKIVVECYVQVQPEKIREKILMISRLVDKLIVCVPEFEARKLEAFSVEIWSYGKVRKRRRLIVSEDVYEGLLKVAADMGVETERPGFVDEALRNLVNSYRTQRR